MMDDRVVVCFGLSRAQYERAVAAHRETWYVRDGGREYWLAGGRPALPSAVKVWDGVGRPPYWQLVHRAILVWACGEVWADYELGLALLRRHGEDC